MQRKTSTRETSATIAGAKTPGRWLLALALLSAWGCSDATPEAPAALAPLVEAVPATHGGLPKVETVTGVVRAENQVAVRAEINATVAEVLVRSGEAVERGQVLVRLDDGELREQLRRTEADVRLAEADLLEAEATARELETRVARFQSLASERLISEQELETLQARLDGEKAAVEAAKAQRDAARATAEERRAALAKSVVRSPVGGRVGVRNAEVGMLVDRGTVLFRVGNLDRLLVEVPLTEAMLRWIEPGQPVRLEVREAAADPVEATLSRVSPFLEEASFTTVGEIDIDNRAGSLKPGMFTTVHILVGMTNAATLVPTNALWEDLDSGRQGVFVVDLPAQTTGNSSDDAEESYPVRFQPIELLAEGGGAIGVDGISSGAWVVVNGQQLLARPGTGQIEARVRRTDWQRVQQLQGLQREDLLRSFMDRQQRIAASLGAEIPENEEVVDRLLAQPEAAAVPLSAEPQTGS